jgi:hypothetical protein
MANPINEHKFNGWDAVNNVQEKSNNLSLSDSEEEMDPEVANEILAFTLKELSLSQRLYNLPSDPNTKALWEQQIRLLNLEAFILGKISQGEQ